MFSDILLQLGQLLQQCQRMGIVVPEEYVTVGYAHGLQSLVHGCGWILSVQSPRVLGAWEAGAVTEQTDGELRGEGGGINQRALPFTCGRGGPAFGKQCSTKELCTISDPPSQKGTGVIRMTFNKISPCIHNLQDLQAIFSYHFKMEGI